jgi:hypothetical protein
MSAGLPLYMQPATVRRYDAAKGCGDATLRSSGRAVRLPWCVLKELRVALTCGQTIYVSVDRFDKSRVEEIWVAP